MVGLLSPTLFTYMKLNDSVFQKNNEEYSVPMAIQNTNQNISHFTIKTINKSAKPSKAITKMHDNFRSDSLYEETYSDEISDKLVFWIFTAMIILKPFIQFFIWMLAKKITQPIDTEAAHQSEELLQTTATEDQNLEIEQNLIESSSLVNSVVIHRKRKTSGRDNEESSTEDLDGVNYNALTVDSPLTELGNKSKSEEKLPISNLSASEIITLEKDSLQPISTNNVPKVVVTEASFQEELPEFNI